jgi:signal peptidase I
MAKNQDTRSSETKSLVAFYREWFAQRPKPEPGEQPFQYTGFKKWWHSWIWPLIWAVIVVKLLINPFLLEAYEVPTESMVGTILPGDRLMADKFTYGINIPFTDKLILSLTRPHPGQIVVFKGPYDGKTLVKRCIGGPGDVIEVRHKKLFINGREMDEPYTRHVDDVEYPLPKDGIDPAVFQRYWERGQLDQTFWVRDNFGPVRVPADCFFMMGDNRDNSFDSRFWGPLPRNMVRGRPLIIFFSLDRFSDIPLSKLWQRFHLTRIGKIML